MRPEGDPGVARSIVAGAFREQSAGSGAAGEDRNRIDDAAIVLGRIRTTRSLRGTVLPVSIALAEDDKAEAGRLLPEHLVRAIRRAAGVETDPASDPEG